VVHHVEWREFGNLGGGALMAIDNTELSTRHASLFSSFARWCSRAAGTSSAFVAAVAIVVVWAATGPLFGFSDTWQLVINTGTTIVTFLMVFAIQASQNRDSEAIQVKLDELIRSIEGAQNSLLDLEELEAGDIERLRTKYRTLASKARESEGSGTDCPPAPT
jgi:low affinity Fe/Cu permease